VRSMTAAYQLSHALCMWQCKGCLLILRPAVMQPANPSTTGPTLTTSGSILRPSDQEACKTGCGRDTRTDYLTGSWPYQVP
jgi:hypothetical protein